jgi:hypothetical protein
VSIYFYDDVVRFQVSVSACFVEPDD